MTDRPCHYDVLGVKKQADDDTIKRAYKRLALFWHPDKNPDRKEEATDAFGLVSEAYAVLGDPQQRRKYDRDGHPRGSKSASRATASSCHPSAPASARASARAPSPAPAPAAPAPAAPAPARRPAPPTPSAPPHEPHQHVPQQAPHQSHEHMPQQGPQHVPQQAPVGWGGGAAPWQGVPCAGYDPGWLPQAYPSYEAPPPFVQPHPFQQPASHFPQEASFPYDYGNPYVQQQGYPFQPQQQQAPPPPPFDPYYGGYGGGLPPQVSPPQMPPVPASAPTSTELSLAHASSAPPGPAPFEYGYAPFGYPGGVPQTLAHPIVAQPVVAHPAVARPVVAPPSGPPALRPPSSDSEEESSESEEDSSDSEAETGMDRALGPASTPAPAKEPPSRRSSRFQLLRRNSTSNAAGYPTETRYVPPPPSRMNAGYYPKETRDSADKQERDQPNEEPCRPATHTRTRSGRLALRVVLSASLPMPSSPASTRTPSAPPVPSNPTRNSSHFATQMRRSSQGSGTLSRGGSLFGTEFGNNEMEGRLDGGLKKFGVGGGLFEQMDRMFSSVMGGGMLGIAGGLEREKETGAGAVSEVSGLSRSYSTGSNASRGGVGRVSMKSSRTTRTGLDGTSSTIFSRSERTVVNTDGSRKTEVEEFVNNGVGGPSSGQLPYGGSHDDRSSSSSSRRPSVARIFGGR